MCFSQKQILIIKQIHLKFIIQKHIIYMNHHNHNHHQLNMINFNALPLDISKVSHNYKFIVNIEFKN